MKIKIHRGTNQIGGCITEIESNKGNKIIIDIGTNLPNADSIKSPEITLEGLTKGKPKYKAVFVTHYHGDHIGLYNKVLPEIPIYIGEISKGIYSIVQNRLSRANLVNKEDLKKISKFNTFTIKNKILIDDIKITPIAVDHSAFDSYMFLIEADGQKILHTGDFRTHGQRGKAVLEAIKKYVRKVDCLICEGTTLTRDNTKVLTEFELQKKAEKIFKENKYNFVLCSSTNIDRIAALHKATLNCHKMFICDNYQCELLEYINSISRSSLYKFNDSNNIKNTKVYCYGTNMLKQMKEYGFVMLVRANTKFAKFFKIFEDSTFIYSQWLGYLKGKNKDYKRIQEFVPKDYIYLHTSGHASPDAIKEVINITNPNYVIPIHTEDKKRIKELTDKAIILEDNEEFKLNEKRRDEKMENKELCKKILDLNENIVIVGPAFGKLKNHLRVYYNGGVFATIYDGDYKTGKSNLMDKKYAQAKYCSDADKLGEFIKKANDEEKIDEIISNPDFFKLAQEAFKKRWEKAKNGNGKEALALYERNVETKIIRKFMNPQSSKSNFITIDMEVECPKEWFENTDFDKELKKIEKTERPKFDIITISKDGIGIIELKLNNEHYDNINSHYAHMKHILNNVDGSKDLFVKEIQRRIKHLRKNELINEETLNSFGNYENKVWCGFLFVGGGKSGSITIVKQLEKLEAQDKLKFLYCDEDKIDSINIDNMQNYQDFTKGSE